MIGIKWHLILIFIIAGCALSVFAQTTLSFDNLLDDLSEKMDDQFQSNRKVRLAVMSLVPSDAQAGSPQDKFGSYFAESLISALSKKSEKFKLYERSRLDAVLQEAALQQSGILDSKAALKLGELAPIDVIFSGTYTRLKDNVAINGRVIDVVSGEILLAYSASLAWNDNLSPLFYNPSEKEKAKSICQQKQDVVTKLLNDLSSADKVNAVSNAAMVIPFDTSRCATIHYKVMYTFKRFNIDDPDYERFLMATLDNIEFPQNDERAIEILRYVGKDGVIDDAEWKSGLAATVKVGNYNLSSFLRALILPEQNDSDASLVLKRSKTVLDLARDGKIGLPVPIDFNTALFALMRAFNYTYAKDNRFIYDLYDAYRTNLAHSEKQDLEIASLLDIMYWRESDPQKRQTILDWLGDHYNHCVMTEKLGEDLYGFVRSMDSKGKGEYNPEGVIAAPVAHIAYIAKKCSSQLCAGLAIAKFRSQVEERQEFCLQNGIDCPGVLPTVSELLQQLDAEKPYDQERAAKLLALMGEKAKAAESKMIDIVAGARIKRDDYGRGVRMYAIQLLGRLKTKDERAIRGIADHLGSLEYSIPDEASDALISIGAPAVKVVSEKLFSNEGSVAYRAAVILGKMGKTAIAAKPSLEKVIATTNNYAVKEVAQQALYEISGQ